jgi:hypothetical protein
MQLAYLSFDLRERAAHHVQIARADSPASIPANAN